MVFVCWLRATSSWMVNTGNRTWVTGFATHTVTHYIHQYPIYFLHSFLLYIADAIFPCHTSSSRSWRFYVTILLFNNIKNTYYVYQLCDDHQLNIISSSIIPSFFFTIQEYFLKHSLTSSLLYSKWNFWLASQQILRNFHIYTTQ